MTVGRKSDESQSPQTAASEQKIRGLEQWVAVLCATLDSTADGILVVDGGGGVLYFNETYLRLWGLNRDAVKGRQHSEIVRRISGQFADPVQFLTRVQEIYASADAASADVLKMADGRIYERSSRVQRVDGQILGRVWTFRDVTNLHQLTHMLEQRVAERTKALDRTERQFQQLVNGVRDCAIYMLDREGHVASWNPGAERIKGYAAGEIIGQHFSVFYTPEDRANGVPTRALEIARREGKYEGEAWRMRKDGTRFWASVLIDAIHDGEGQLIGFAKITRDMTERRAMQDQLHQSQKMEAIGQLTGGVAHDFNNLLTVILGNLDTVSRHMPQDERLRRATDQAIRGAQRAATLTQQLLAFARRQPLNPKPSDINALVTGMTDLVQRTLGERISVATRLQPALWPVEIDPHQLESAILNLAVNSRDAMPGSGQLTIETQNLTLAARQPFRHADVGAGDYALIRVTDTGTGMSSEVLAHAFDPFFTTKPIGEGTGLGLSQVFGFVKQSGGYVNIASELGRGTSVTLYLPRLQGDVATVESDTPIANVRGRANETVLVVEDDDDVRLYSTESLRDLGFTVLEACDGPTALRTLEAHPEIQLLFTDVGLPGMNGRQLVEEARQHRPELKVLFTSGYPRQAIVHDGRLDPGVELLRKPFSRDQLGARIREVFDMPQDVRLATPKAALVVDDEILIGMFLTDVLQELGFNVIQAASATEGLAALNDVGALDIAFIDIGLPDRNGVDLARELRERLPRLKIALASGYSDQITELQADPNVTFLPKPFDTAAVKGALRTLNVAH